MTPYSSANSHLEYPNIHFHQSPIPVVSILIPSLFVPSALSTPLRFSFDSDAQEITYEGGASASDKFIQLNGPGGNQDRAIYSKPLQLWERETKELADLTTKFSFIIDPSNNTNHGDRLAFFLAPRGSTIPAADSRGGLLALVNSTLPSNFSRDQIVAVEFDTHQDSWDPSGNHIGINVNSIVSVADAIWNSSMWDGRIANAWVNYDSTSKNLSVILTYIDSYSVFKENSSLSYVIDLRDYLPEWVTVGFSASTGFPVEQHKTLSWEFDSSLETETLDRANLVSKLITALSNEAGSLGCMGVGWFLLWMKRGKERREGDEDMVLDDSVNDEFEKGTGPKRFSYGELARATSKFLEERKLGEGGFGGVYRGFLRDLNLDVAVKRVSKNSKQGIKEYMAEVKIISRLRHKNLVQLVGWCHQRNELILVYEYMPNGSLDSYLFKQKGLLSWDSRYKIALGLASALFYLHEGWEQCVLHRDIKSSNVMLDSSFNAKLGDFGLAKLVDHEQLSQTTVPAGTMGYMAPEYCTSGKASKESDVYSFGIVALEIACGRRSVELKFEEGKMMLVEWVWELYGRGKVLEAIDPRLRDMSYDEEQVECLMIVGLWCAHPDHHSRPSMRQVMHVLSFEASLPTLPSNMPVPTYYSPASACFLSNITSSFDVSNTERVRTKSSFNSCTTDDSSRLTTASAASSDAFLLNPRRHGHGRKEQSVNGGDFHGEQMDQTMPNTPWSDYII
ncbi:PREDICTED: L-type lectin-domain containing receptor kinase IX.1-like [Nelumbo nucifera]|uniref:non-specific serine/threonine protein kinase n=1 Tax=Nelumbo nucifera TaxID=4432 RepID=A0A1U8Q4P7_NELNU|nr:PREDICTED: L-type lectin-domain containing receptor kinase IX.1-like [Nelumbo nucifera]